MKKILIKVIAISVIVTASVAQGKCLTQEDRIGFGVIGAVQGAIIGGPLGFIWAVGAMKYAEVYEDKLDCTQENLAQKFEQAKIKLEEKTSENKVILYDSFVKFDYNSYIIKFVPEKLKLISKDNLELITITGHTDKRGTNEYNFALGLKRAKEVKQLFIDNDFNPSQIKTVSNGESSPISNDKSTNRRVDLKIQYK